jgi:S1-C subfamily serine protease
MLSRYFTGFLTILIVLNIAVMMFVMMGIGWQEIIEVPTYILRGLGDPSQVPSRFGGIEAGREIKTVAGVVDDPNIKLVCSDETFAAAVSKVRPAVVNISCENIETAPRTPGALRFDDPAQDLSILGGIGSGMIVNPKGYILTCDHVIAKASNVFVTPFGPRVKRYRARLVARDEELNLALLKIDVTEPLPVVTTGDSSHMEAADVVLAVGSPFGLEQSVTHGIVSDNARDLLIGGRLYRSMMQTDVPINRGSSGGPLININGEVVAINMAIYSTTGVYNGVSFAMPIDRAKPFLARTVPLVEVASAGVIR